MAHTSFSWECFLCDKTKGKSLWNNRLEFTVKWEASVNHPFPFPSLVSVNTTLPRRPACWAGNPLQNKSHSNFQIKRRSTEGSELENLFSCSLTGLLCCLLSDLDSKWLKPTSFKRDFFSKKGREGGRSVSSWETATYKNLKSDLLFHKFQTCQNIHSFYI